MVSSCIQWYERIRTFCIFIFFTIFNLSHSFSFSNLGKSITRFYIFFLLLNENDPKSFRWSCITLAMMFYGLLTILFIDGKNSQPVLIGAYVWVFSGVLLCICAYIKVKKISKNH